MRLFLVCIVGVAASCGGGGPISSIDVASATITNVYWSGGGAVVGGSTMTGVLNIVDTSGVTRSFKIDMSGPSLGVVLDVSGGDISGGATLTLPPGRQIKGSDLLGSYVGDKVAIQVVLGAEQHDLSNVAGVKISSGVFELGFGVYFAFEWLSLSLSA